MRRLQNLKAVFSEKWELKVGKSEARNLFFACACSLTGPVDSENLLHVTDGNNFWVLIEKRAKELSATLQFGISGY